MAGEATVISTTYYNGEDGWYLELPSRWIGHIALARQDDSSSEERGVLFYPYTEGAEGEAPQPFLAIYRLTGPNQTIRAQAGDRFVLLTKDDAIYAAEFFQDSGWDCGVDAEELKTLFHLIQPEWVPAY